MKLTTVTIPAIEMTQKEENALWDIQYPNRFVEGKRVHLWNTRDGNNEIQLEGEDFYRVVVIKRDI